MARTIGIQHRRKKTVDGEARPTILTIAENSRKKTVELSDVMAELDWAFGKFPVEFRQINKDDKPETYLPRHIKWRKIKKEQIGDYPADHLRQKGGYWYAAAKVPSGFDGLRAGDQIAMTLGGSGDKFAFILSRRGEEIGAKVWRIPPFMLKNYRDRENRKKDGDAELLEQMLSRCSEEFHETKVPDRQLISVRNALRARNDAMKARIACEQRIYTRVEDELYFNSVQSYPEESFEVLYEQAKDRDKILRNLIKEEAERMKALKMTLETLPVYNRLFVPTAGCGPAIAARLISAIQDIRRFPTDAKLKAFCGAHLIKDGKDNGQSGGDNDLDFPDSGMPEDSFEAKVIEQTEEWIFPRRRGGQISNWHPDARQALYLLGYQFNYRPDSVWGQKLLDYKKHFRAVHPETLCKQCGCPKTDCRNENHSSKYSDGHILRMATWRTLTKFVEWLWHEWWREVEKEKKQNGFNFHE